MTELTARLKEIAEKTTQDAYAAPTAKLSEYFESAINQTIREVLTMEPSEEVIKAGRHALRHTASNVLTTDAYRAMNEARLKELGLWARHQGLTLF